MNEQKDGIRAKYQKQIDISLELLYALSKMRNANLRGDDFYEI